MKVANCDRMVIVAQIDEPLNLLDSGHQDSARGLNKSNLTTHGLVDNVLSFLNSFLNIPREDLDEGLKYLVFYLKSCNYRFNDWL